MPSTTSACGTWSGAAEADLDLDLDLEVWSVLRGEWQG